MAQLQLRWSSKGQEIGLLGKPAVTPKTEILFLMEMTNKMLVDQCLCVSVPNV